MLTFTDQQIKDMSKDALLLPFLINAPETGYVAQKAAFQLVSNNFATTDAGQKVFSDFYEDVQQKYHSELALLNNSSRTNYADSELVSGGLGTGLHFPFGSWVNFPPKIINSVTGLPVTTLSNTLESDLSTGVTFAIDVLKNGFNDNAFNATVTVGAGIFTSNSSMGSLGANHKLVISNGTQAFFVKITSITLFTDPNPPNLTTYTAHFTLLFGTPFTGTANASATTAGFTNAQRNGSVSTFPNTYIYNVITAAIDATVVSWKAYIQSFKNIIDSNGDLPPRKTNNTAASTACGSAITVATTWQAKPLSTTAGRFTDTHIAPLGTLATTRTSYISARITEVGTNLGTVTQAGNGTFTSNGAYGDLFKNIDIRISRGVGTLSKYNDAQLCLTFFDKKIASANDQLTQYNNTFAITKILADTVIGQIDFQVASVADFTVGDSVKLMDNNGSVYSRTIILITADVIKVSSGIPSVLTIGNMARIVKLK